MLAAVLEQERRARIVEAVADKAGQLPVDVLMQRVCRFVVDEAAASDCTMVLIAGSEPVATLAGAGCHARAITDLQFELGEGPCLDAHGTGFPVLLPDLVAQGSIRWPVFTQVATSLGVRAEFCFPLGIGVNSVGVLNLCRDEPGMLSKELLADALVAADIARDALLYLEEPPGDNDLTALLDAVGMDRLVVHQAAGMIAAQLGEAPSDALARLRGAAFESGRSIYSIAQDVIERRVRLGE